MNPASARPRIVEAAGAGKVTQAFQPVRLDGEQAESLCHPPATRAAPEVSAMKQFVLHLLRAAQVLLAAAVVCAAQYARADTFTDDFNRSDSSIVGNGWLNSPGNVGGNMLITGNKVGVPTNSGAGTLYRPFNSTSFPIHVQTKLYQGHGFAGVTSRFNHFIQIRNDGGYLRGYGLNVVRSDINSSNSQVIRVDTSGASGGAAQVDFQNSTFQFSANLDLDATYYADGSIIGTLKDAVNTFAFTFPAHAIVASGSYFALSSEYTGDTLNTRFDDVILNGQGSASDPLAPGNSGWWKFYVPSSNGTFPDLSGNGNTASMTGGSAGKIGQRTTLTSTATGINISVPASASLDPASGYTFSSLVYLPSTGMGYSSTAYSLSYADGAYPDKVLVSTYKAGTQYSSFSLIMNNLIEAP